MTGLIYRAMIMVALAGGFLAGWTAAIIVTGGAL